jgi:hypothetical protein
VAKNFPKTSVALLLRIRLHYERPLAPITLEPQALFTLKLVRMQACFRSKKQRNDIADGTKSIAGHLL